MGYQMTQSDGRAKCAQDSDAATPEDSTVTEFLHLPRPRNLVENQFYIALNGIYSTDVHFWLDMSEVLPITGDRRWVYNDGSPVPWSHWHPNEPNNAGNEEHSVQMGVGGMWNDINNRHMQTSICTYHLPAGAEEICPWLQDFVP